MNSILESLPANVPVKLLKSGLPEFEKGNVQQDDSPPNYWHLAKEMDALQSDSIIVLTNAFVSGVKGKRPQIAKKINWILLDPGEPNRQVVQAISKGDEVELIRIGSDHKVLKFEKGILPKNSNNLNFSAGNDSILVSSKGEEIQVKIYPADSISVLIVKNGFFEQEAKFIQASYAAIAEYLGQPVHVEVINCLLYTSPSPRDS